jgi:hypothetical protein
MSVGVSYNETTVMISGSSTQGAKPRQLRLEGIMNTLFDSFINAKMGTRAFDHAATLVGLKEMPKLAGWFVHGCFGRFTWCMRCRNFFFGRKIVDVCKRLS